MAERRMFAKTIIDSDAFIDMPVTARLLYYDLAMRADDDGFVNSPKKIMKMIGASEDDIKLLLAKRFLIAFESGVVVIKHWRIHNYIQNDRHKRTAYIDEFKQLAIDENRAYTKRDNLSENGDVSKMDTECIQDVSRMDTQVRLGKDRLGKASIEREGKTASRFTPPTLEEVKAYCLERGNNVDAQRFVDYYSSIGWVVGKARTPMKDWRASVRTWEKSEKQYSSSPASKQEPELSEEEKQRRAADLEDFRRNKIVG